MSYSSHEISEFFGDRRTEFLDALEGVVQAIGKVPTVRINFVFTVLNTLLLKEGVKYYGAGGSPIRTVQPLQFLDDLVAYYPYVCAWKVAKAYKIVGTNVILDNFRGEITSAWGELRAHHQLTVVPGGDLCNPLISAADLCVRYFGQSPRWR